MLVQLAEQNGIVLSADLKEPADPLNTKRNPLRAIVSDCFQRIKRQSRLHKLDYESVAALMKRLGGVKGTKVFHQRADPSNDNPRLRAEIAVVGLTAQLAQAVRTGEFVIGFDAGFGLDSYGHPTWMIVGRNDFGQGTPIAYATSSDSTLATQVQVLRQINIMIHHAAWEAGTLRLNVMFAPRCVSIDRDEASRQAVLKVWPTTRVIYCLYHLCVVRDVAAAQVIADSCCLQTVWGWLRDKELKVKSEHQSGVFSQFRTLAAVSDRTAFNVYWRQLRAVWQPWYPLFLAKFEKQLMNSDWADTWPGCAAPLSTASSDCHAEWNRDCLPDAVRHAARTNMLTERMVRCAELTSAPVISLLSHRSSSQSTQRSTRSRTSARTG